MRVRVPDVRFTERTIIVLKSGTELRPLGDRFLIREGDIGMSPAGTWASVWIDPVSPGEERKTGEIELSEIAAIRSASTADVERLKRDSGIDIFVVDDAIQEDLSRGRGERSGS